MKLKPTVWAAIVLFLLYFVVNSPSNADSVVHGLFTWFSDTIHSLGHVLHGLVA